MNSSASAFRSGRWSVLSMPVSRCSRITPSCARCSAGSTTGRVSEMHRHVGCDRQLRVTRRPGAWSPADPPRTCRGRSRTGSMSVSASDGTLPAASPRRITNGLVRSTSVAAAAFPTMRSPPTSGHSPVAEGLRAVIDRDHAPACARSGLRRLRHVRLERSGSHGRTLALRLCSESIGSAPHATPRHRPRAERASQAPPVSDASSRDRPDL